MEGPRGFTLAEIMAAMVIMLLVAGSVHKVLVSTQRLTRAQAQQVSVQSNVRAGSLVIVNELRELSAVVGGTSSQNDILRVAPASVTYRAMRGVGFVCQTPAATEIRIRRTGFSGHRDPQPGRDSIYVFVAGGAGAESAGSWLPLAITGVSTGTCAGASGPAVSLAIPSTASVTGLEVGTPVRVAEVMELRLYQSEGRSWLGARSVSGGEAIQPMAGPLEDGHGLALEYLDGSGSPTSDLTRIKSIRVTLRAPIEGAGIANHEEKLTTQMTLRNALRQ
jgi:prepilin-type N-terminal cleavage/methylation domain-containing protein